MDSSTPIVPPAAPSTAPAPAPAPAHPHDPAPVTTKSPDPTERPLYICETKPGDITLEDAVHDVQAFVRTHHGGLLFKEAAEQKADHRVFTTNVETFEELKQSPKYPTLLKSHSELIDRISKSITSLDSSPTFQSMKSYGIGFKLYHLSCALQKIANEESAKTGGKDERTINGLLKKSLKEALYTGMWKDRKLVKNLKNVEKGVPELLLAHGPLVRTHSPIPGEKDRVQPVVFSKVGHGDVVLHPASETAPVVPPTGVPTDGPSATPALNHPPTEPHTKEGVTTFEGTTPQPKKHKTDYKKLLGHLKTLKTAYSGSKSHSGGGGGGKSHAFGAASHGGEGEHEEVEQEGEGSDASSVSDAGEHESVEDIGRFFGDDGNASSVESEESEQSSEEEEQQEEYEESYEEE